MKKKAKVSFPAKYDQDKAVKKMHDRIWRYIEGCTAEEYFDKVKADIERKEGDERIRRMKAKLKQ